MKRARGRFEQALNWLASLQRPAALQRGLQRIRFDLHRIIQHCAPGRVFSRSHDISSR
jgi:hypothetical protein